MFYNYKYSRNGSYVGLNQFWEIIRNQFRWTSWLFMNKCPRERDRDSDGNITLWWSNESSKHIYESISGLLKCRLRFLTRILRTSNKTTLNGKHRSMAAGAHTLSVSLTTTRMIQIWLLCDISCIFKHLSPTALRPQIHKHNVLLCITELHSVQCARSPLCFWGGEGWRRRYACAQCGRGWKCHQSSHRPAWWWFRGGRDSSTRKRKICPPMFGIHYSESTRNTLHTNTSSPTV